MFRTLAFSLLLTIPIAFAGCGGDDSASGAGEGGSAGNNVAGSAGNNAGGSSNGGGGSAGQATGGAGGEADAGALDGSSDGSVLDGSSDGSVLDGSSDGSVLDGSSDGSALDGSSDGSALDAGDASTKTAHLELKLDHAWAWTKEMEEPLHASCQYVDANGKPQANPADMKIVTTAPNPEHPDCSGDAGAKLDPSCSSPAMSAFLFTTEGAFSVTCSSPSLGLSTQAQVAVMHPMVRYEYVRTVHLLDDFGASLQRLTEANEAGDKSAYDAEIALMNRLSGQVPDVSKDKLMVEGVYSGWPTLAEFEAAAMTAAPGDDAWGAAVDEVAQKLVAERASLQALTNPPTDAQVQALGASFAATNDAVKKLRKLTVSDHGAWKYRSHVQTMLRELNVTLKTEMSVLIPIFQSAPPIPKTTGNGMQLKFGLVGAIAACAVQGALQAAGFRSLPSVGQALAATVVNASVAKLFNKYHKNVDPRAPDVTSIHGSAAGYVVPGNQFAAYGDFPHDYRKTTMVFISPQAGNDAVAGLNSIISWVGAMPKSSDPLHDFKLFQAMRKLFASVYKIATLGLTYSTGKYIKVLPATSGDTMIQYYGPLPTGVNCSPYSLPQPGTMIPLDADYGYGKALSVNVIGESPSACH